MQEFKDMLKFFRMRSNLSQSELAEKLGVAASTISMYEVGKREPDFETEEKIADFFNTDLNTLRGRDNEAKSGVVVNVLGRVAAGIPLEAIEEIVDTEEITEELARSGKFFGLRIQGDSMEPDIHNGDTVIVRQQDDAENDEIVIALVNGNDGVCKRLKKYKDSIALVSLNAKYEPMYFTVQEVDTKPVRIIGKVIELRRKF